jgi:predicted permease
MHFESLLFASAIILPVCLLVCLGVLLRRWAIIDSAFIDVSSSLVFKVTLPALIFLAIADMHINPAEQFWLMLFVAIAILATCAFSYFWAWLIKLPREDLSAFVQASFRSNLGIVGIAMVVYAFGDDGIRTGALVLAVGVPMYNLISVVILAQGQSVSITEQCQLILRNPLIIAIMLAIPFSIWSIPLPSTLRSTAESLGNMTLPLALISIGGSLSWTEFHKANKTTAHIMLLKLGIFPGLILGAGLMFGLPELELSVIVIMLASPTAAAAFVMARNMGGNATLTANAIALTTLGALITTGAYFYVLRLLSLL